MGHGTIDFPPELVPLTIEVGSDDLVGGSDPVAGEIDHPGEARDSYPQGTEWVDTDAGTLWVNYGIAEAPNWLSEAAARAAADDALSTADAAEATARAEADDALAGQLSTQWKFVDKIITDAEIKDLVATPILLGLPGSIMSIPVMMTVTIDPVSTDDPNKYVDPGDGLIAGNFYDGGQSFPPIYVAKWYNATPTAFNGAAATFAYAPENLPEPHEYLPVAFGSNGFYLKKGEPGEGDLTGGDAGTRWRIRVYYIDAPVDIDL